MEEDSGNTPVTGKWALAANELTVEPPSLHSDVMALLYPEGLPAVEGNTGYIFTGEFYRLFDEHGTTGRMRYTVTADTLVFSNATGNLTGVDRSAIFHRTNNELKLGNSVFTKETLDLYKNFREEWERLNAIAWWEDESESEKHAQLSSILEDETGIATLDLFDRGLENVYLYQVFHKTK